MITYFGRIGRMAVKTHVTVVFQPIPAPAVKMAPVVEITYHPAAAIVDATGGLW